MGIRVSLKEEIEGLDIGEHGNQAYPEFVVRRPSLISDMPVRVEKNDK